MSQKKAEQKKEKEATKELKKAPKKSSWLLRLTVFSLSLGIVGACVGLYVVYYYSTDLPDYRQIAEYNPPIVTRFYSSDGKLLEEYAKEHRLFVPIEAIPKHVQRAFIAAEDKNFYDHPGIDISSVFRAMVQNVMNYSQKKTLFGGSTITQQVVKNFLLTKERTLNRKIKEAILAFRVTHIYTKDRILELYLNQIYLGAGAYGVASAALTYFNKSLDELSIEEAAFLAVLPKAPSTYDPKRHYDRAKRRRDWVLERMHEENYITEQQFYEASSRPISLIKRDRAHVAKADFFAESVRREIVDKFDAKTLYEGGLVVHTTLNPTLQDMAETAFKRGLQRYDRRKGFRKPLGHIPTQHWKNTILEIPKPQAAGNWKRAVILDIGKEKISLGIDDGKKQSVPLKEFFWEEIMKSKPQKFPVNVGDIVLVEEHLINNEFSYELQQLPVLNGGMVIIDHQTGHILAMVGGYSFEDSKFNRVTQALRQSGSAFKPFVYLAAMEQGMSPVTIIEDGPIEIDQGPHLPPWTPKNYSGDFLGPLPLRIGLEKSRNTMTVQLAQMIGMESVMEITKRFGINDRPEPHFSTVLGSSETTLLALTNAYAMIANGGKRIEPSAIDRIQNRHGKTIYRHDKRVCGDCVVTSDAQITSILPPIITDERESVTDPRSAFQITSMLQGSVERGTSRRAKVINYPLASKTGTTNNSMDTWFVGYNPEFAIGIYLGFDTPQDIGKRETGATTALPVYVEFMKQYVVGRTPPSFKIPTGVSFMNMNLKTGLPASEEDPEDEVFTEVFKNGTEPVLQITVEPEETMPTLPLFQKSKEDEAVDGFGGLY